MGFFYAVFNWSMLKVFVRNKWERSSGGKQQSPVKRMSMCFHYHLQDRPQILHNLMNSQRIVSHLFGCAMTAIAGGWTWKFFVFVQFS